MKLEEIGRRGFIVFLLATLAAASAPASAAPKRASRGLVAAGEGGLWELGRRAAAWAAEEGMKQERP
jgi:tripartite-type tricarboxylate transporter receptor subunit TctC